MKARESIGNMAHGYACGWCSRGRILSASVLILLVLIGCDQDANKKVVDLKTCDCEVVPKREMRSLRDEAELGKQINRFQMRNDGLRTWRFDTATGRVCLLLSTESDWKKPEAESQKCPVDEDQFWSQYPVSKE